MSLVIAGEIDKLGILYEKYKKPLYSYFFKLTTGDRQASEDLVHTVFYRVIKYKASFRGHGSFLSWIFKIAHNAGLDHNRKIQYLNNYKNEILATQKDFFESNDLEKQERKVILKNAMRKLNQEERELLILGKIDHLKYKEIADMLNLSESNVKIRMFRALKKLKEIYVKLERTGYEKAGT
jgi:RNA polymerase sigma factor (sigma-70 family)